MAVREKSTATEQAIREKLITAGVKNLKEFGYPAVTPENILTDYVYRSFFKSMLKDNRGKAGVAVDTVIDKLLAEIAEAKEP